MVGSNPTLNQKGRASCPDIGKERYINPSKEPSPVRLIVNCSRYMGNSIIIMKEVAQIEGAYSHPGSL